MTDVVVYDPRHTSVGGTHAIFLMRGTPADFILPADPIVPTELLPAAWRSAAWTAIGLLATIVGAIALGQ
jgi:DNA-binding transcriptional regulator PaaX